jgi:hypothetical protein
MSVPLREAHSRKGDLSKTPGRPNLGATRSLPGLGMYATTRSLSSIHGFMSGCVVDVELMLTATGPRDFWR